MDKDKQVITDLQEKEGQYKIILHRTLQNIPMVGWHKIFRHSVQETNLHLNLNKHEQAIQDSCLFKYYHFRINVALALILRKNTWWLYTFLLDQVAFASASKFSGNYCVTASVDTVDFLNPIEVGELVTMKASVNYVGNSSDYRHSRRIRKYSNGTIKHCNSSYFTMVSKTKMVRTKSPSLILSSLEEVRRFINCLKQISLKKRPSRRSFDYTSKETLASLGKYNVMIELN
jgi:acyl-CoA hydrolase